MWKEKPETECAWISNCEVEKLLLYQKKYSYSAKAESLLIQKAGELKEVLSDYLFRHRLHEENEMPMAENAEAFSEEIVAYLKKYKRFANIDANIELIGKGKNVRDVFASLAEAEYCMEEAVELLCGFCESAPECPEAVLAFAKILQRYEQAQESNRCNEAAKKLDLRLFKLNKLELIIKRTRLLPQWQKPMPEEIFKAFINAADEETLKRYFSANKISQEYQKLLCFLKKWIAINAIISTGRAMKFAPDESVIEFFKYNSENNNLEILQKLLKDGEFTCELRRKAVYGTQNKDIVNFYVQKCYGGCRDIDLPVFLRLHADTPEIFLTLLKNIEFGEEYERILFEAEFQPFLLLYAGSQQFKNWQYSFNFLMMLKKYPEDVRKYMARFGKDMYLYANAENTLFEPENREELLFFASYRRFNNHYNEFRFLMMLPEYPVAVADYIQRYRDSFSFTTREEVELYAHNNDILKLFDERHPLILKQNAVPAYCRRPYELKTDEISVLVELSLTNPQPLVDCLAYNSGILKPELAAKLFFFGDKELAANYLGKKGIELKCLVECLKQNEAMEDCAKTANSLWKQISKGIGSTATLFFLDEKNFVVDLGCSYLKLVFNESAVQESQLIKLIGCTSGDIMRNRTNSPYKEMKDLVTLCFAAAERNRLTV